MQKGAHIPDELIFDILWRLPAKSLVRFKCVCKSWLSFISQLRYENEELILHTSFCFHSIEFKESEIKQVMLGFPLRNSLNSKNATVDSTVVGSCNGLLCVRNRGDGIHGHEDTKCYHQKLRLQELQITLDLVMIIPLMIT